MGSIASDSGHIGMVGIADSSQWPQCIWQEVDSFPSDGGHIGCGMDSVFQVIVATLAGTGEHCWREWPVR